MSEEQGQKDPVRPFTQMASDFLLRSRWAQKVREGGSVRIPGMNPLVLLVVVVALIGGGVFAYRTFVSGPDSKCGEMEEAFDLISMVPPPNLSKVPDALLGTSIEVDLLDGISQIRERWSRAVRTQNSEYATAAPDDIAAIWNSAITEQRVNILAEAGC